MPACTASATAFGPTQGAARPTLMDLGWSQEGFSGLADPGVRVGVSERGPRGSQGGSTNDKTNKAVDPNPTKPNVKPKWRSRWRLTDQYLLLWHASVHKFWAGVGKGEGLLVLDASGRGESLAFWCLDFGVHCCPGPHPSPGSCVGWYVHAWAFHIISRTS